VSPNRSNRLARAITAGLVIVATVLLLPSPASADPAGPTDFQTNILKVEPPTPGVAFTVIGGDSFIEVQVEPGIEVMVVGYRGEPYLHFMPSGLVYQNERSPSRWLNDDRFGEVVIPPKADASAEPEWVEVATDGSFAWHDHRTHWMNESKPPGVEVGEIVLEAVVPLLVDGEEVALHVDCILLASPSPVAVIIGVVAGIAFGAAAMRQASGSLVQVGLAIAAALATTFGVWALVSVPSETGPSPLLWLLPGIATVAALVALVWSIRQRAEGNLTPGGPLVGAALFIPSLTAIAGFELVIWGWVRREAMIRALIPSNAPGPLDRAVIAGAAAVGVVTIVAAARAILASTGARPAPGPERPVHRPPSPT
jgi:hypothetical protein